jgi:predicted SnoaL-like aldol condensation-catalyzing enzyme
MSVRPVQVVGVRFLLAIAILLLLALTGVGTMAYFGTSNVDKFKELGPWGDFFGGVLNPILTFFAFLGVLITIVLQKIELNLTRAELERSADALETQIDAIRKQNFEATFFQMLTLHNNIVNSIDLVNSQTGVRTSGRDCFRVFYTRLTKIYRDRQKRMGTKFQDDKILAVSYRAFWKEAQLDLGHYFRFLFNMIRFVKENPEHINYVKLIRSQLSDQELLLLFYNCLGEHGSKFKVFAEEFELFDNMPVIRLLEANHRNRFAESAFGIQT